MKTLTKILTVVALVVLCVALFTVTAFAATATVSMVDSGTPSTCQGQGHEPYIVADGVMYEVSNPSSYEVGKSYEVGGLTQITTPTLKPAATANHTNLQNYPAVAADCTTAGHAEYWHCSGCNKYYATQADALTDSNAQSAGYFAVAALGHNPGGVVAANGATCTHEGNQPYCVCTRCGAIIQAPGGTTPTAPYSFYSSMADTVIPKTGHAWNAWEIIKNPTNVSPGQRKRTCANCDAVEYEEIPATGITDGEDLWYVIMTRDTWLRGEEPLTFESNLVAKLNAESGPNANYVGVRIGTDSLYENSYDTFDFWSWDEYVKLGEKTMAGLREGTYRLWIYDKRHPDVYTNSRPFYVVDVPTLEPYNTDKHVVNSSKSLRFVASEEIQPTSVMVGSRKLYDANDFFVSNDRKNITLSPDFLNARQTGTYTISALTKDGRTIKTNFYILSTAQASSSPRTGDESQIGLWAAFLLLSGAAIVVMVPKLRKHGVK